MKRTLALLAAAVMVAAPFAIAHAQDAAPAAAEAAAPYQVTLQDGTKVSIEGDKAFVMDAEGNKTPAPDGDHMLADGSKMTVAGGMITAGKPAMPAPAEGTPE